MAMVTDMSKDKLVARAAELRAQYEEYKAMGLQLNMARGKPGPEQMDLTMDLLSCVNERDGFVSDSGVDVRLMMPGIPDHKFAYQVAQSYFPELTGHGVKIYTYTPGLIHGKTVMVDREAAFIGSVNMDFRSFEHNFEINAFVYDREFASRMAAIFEDDLTHCHTVTPGEWFTRPRTRRVAESLMRVFSPLL